MLAPNFDRQPTVTSVFTPRTIIEPDGRVEGYASLFGEIDASRDMVMRGAFHDTLLLRGVRRIPMLFQHDPAEPVGIWLELREDAHGLYARGRLIPDVARGRELISLIRDGAIDGLSIGFRTLKGRVDPKTRVRKLEAVELWEISIVTFPLLAGARVRTVKQAQDDARLFRRHPRLSFARACAEREWSAAGGAGAAPVAPKQPGAPVIDFKAGRSPNNDATARGLRAAHWAAGNTRVVKRGVK